MRECPFIDLKVTDPMGILPKHNSMLILRKSFDEFKEEAEALPKIKLKIKLKESGRVMEKTLLDNIRELLNLKEGQDKWIGNNGNEYTINNYGEILRKDNYIDLRYIKLNDIKQRWKPKNGETYYTPSLGNIDSYCSKYWTNDPNDIRLFDRGLVFKTKEEAVECTEKMLEVIK